MSGVPQNTNFTKLNDLLSVKEPSALLQKMVGRNVNQPSMNNNPMTQTLHPKQAKLTDLWPEEKRKIGELVKKLAEEKRMREEYQK